MQLDQQGGCLPNNLMGMLTLATVLGLAKRRGDLLDQPGIAVGNHPKGTQVPGLDP